MRPYTGGSIRQALENARVSDLNAVPPDARFDACPFRDEAAEVNECGKRRQWMIMCVIGKSVFVEAAMKNYTQVYVKNSYEAAETYCRAFGAEITREFKNEDNTAYEHCELSVDGEGFLALAEAKKPCDIDIVHKYKWETMTFNVFEMGTEEAVYNAFQVLSDGGVIIEPIGELPWSKCCATIIDKYGVCWWISI